MNNYCLLTQRVTFICLLLLVSSSLKSQKLVYAKAISNYFPPGGNIFPTGTKMDKAGNTYMYGSFEGTADFDPGSGTVDKVSAGLSDMFIAKYDASGKYIFAQTIGTEGSNVGTAMAIDGVGNIYITGYESDSVDFDPGPAVHKLATAGDGYMFVAKYDANGNFMFLKCIPGQAYPNSIIVDAEANVYVTGNFIGAVDFDPGVGVTNLNAPISSQNSDAFFARYDTNGNYIYAKAIVGPGNETIGGLAVDDSANVYITGTFDGHIDFSSGAGVTTETAIGNDIFFAKYNKLAQLQFVKFLTNPGQAYSIGITLDDAGGFYITGTFEGSMDFDPGTGTAIPESSIKNGTFFVGRYDTAGNYKFVKTIVGDGYVAGRVWPGAAGYITVSGSFRGTADFDTSPDSVVRKSPFESNNFVARYDTSMNLIYVATTNIPNYEMLGFDGAGNMHVVGEFTGSVDFYPETGYVNLHTIVGLRNIFIGTLKSDGSLITVGQIGGYGTFQYNEVCNSIAVDHKGNTYLTGFFNGGVDLDPGPGHAYIISNGNKDVFVAKYDRNGKYVWAFGLGSNSIESGTSIAVDDLGYVYVMGSFSKTVDFDPGPGISTRKSKGRDDTFFAKYDSNGHFVYAKSIGAEKDELIHDMKVDSAGNLFLAGSINTVHDADPDEGVFNVGSKDALAFFFAKYDPSGKLVFAKSLGTEAGDALSLAIDRKGNTYFTGFFRETVDFDPGSQIANLVSTGHNSVFIASYDALGNYRFAKAMTCTSSQNLDYFHSGHSIAVDDKGSIYITGNITSPTDFDPGPGVAMVISYGTTIFFAKYDAAGNCIYARGIDGNGYTSPTSLAFNNAGEVYIAGHFWFSFDLDPGEGQAPYRSVGTADYFIAKYDKAGDFVFSKVIGTTSHEFDCYMTTDDAENIYFTGALYDMKSIDMNDTTTILTGNSIFFAKYSDSIKIKPVTFSIRYVDNVRQTNIKWGTASQSSIISFEVERSQDSVHFEVINIRSGCIDCATSNNYEFNDTRPYSGKSYYRLKITDNNHHTSYSQTLSINVKEVLSSTLYVFPVVTNNAFQVFIKNKNLRRLVVIQLASAYGMIISEQTVMLNDGDNVFNYNLANKPPGLYYIRIAGKEGESLVPVWVIKK